MDYSLGNIVYSGREVIVLRVGGGWLYIGYVEYINLFKVIWYFFFKKKDKEEEEEEIKNNKKNKREEEEEEEKIIL